MECLRLDYQLLYYRMSFTLVHGMDYSYLVSLWIYVAAVSDIDTMTVLPVFNFLVGIAASATVTYVDNSTCFCFF